MEKSDWLELIHGNDTLIKVLDMNDYTERFGLSLSDDDAELLVSQRKESLNQQHRVEFGEGILPRLIFSFCDSQYINQDNYVETIGRLQDIFYLYKNETMDELSDDELLEFMREQFETNCYGDLEYLEGTCLEVFSRAIREAYKGYKKKDDYRTVASFEVVPQWHREIFLEVLQELEG